MIQSHVRRNKHGEPVVTFRAVAIHDVMRWAIHMLRGQVEFCEIGAKTLRSLRRQVGAVAFDNYLALLVDEDSRDFALIRSYSIRRRGAL